MNPNCVILKYILNINIYNKYRTYINIKDNKELYFLYSSLDYLIDKYNRDISFDEFSTYCLSNTKDLEVTQALLESIRSYEIGEDLLLDLLNTAKERAVAYDVALLAIEVNEGRKSYTDLLTKIKENETIEVGAKENEFVTDDLEVLHHDTFQIPGLRWRLGTLNRMLGSLRRGDFGFIFARPETGKTTFLASEISYFAEQTRQPVLWFNNEEQGSKVQLRCYQAALGLTLTELFSNIHRNRQSYVERIGGRVKIYDSANISKTDVVRLCEEYKPSLVVFDQIDKIKGFDGDREDLRLGSIYQWAREIAKSYCPVIGVTQADGSGEGKKWLTMENVANAKTAKQAEADWILGIGATHDDGFEYVRHLHLSKNKLSGDEDTDPTLRHGKMDVLIKPDIARYEDFGD